MADDCLGSEDTHENSGSDSTEAEEGLGRGCGSAWVGRARRGATANVLR